MAASSASTSATASASSAPASKPDARPPPGRLLTDIAGGADAAERRSRLLALKLRALVRARIGVEGESHPFALGAAVTAGDEAWILVEDAGADGRGLGAALAWALRREVAALHVVAEAGASVMARRADEFTLPVSVWMADGTELRPAVAEPPGLAVEPDPRHLELLPAIAAAGATPTVEHGVVTGEVRGLEVCRVVTVEGDQIRLEVGVGAHDREAFALIHGNVPTHEALTGVVTAVLAQRDAGIPAHPLNRLAPERFLRWQLQQVPELIGLGAVVPAPSPVPRLNLKDRSPATALGRHPDGREAVVVTSVGVDLDLIPYAADARLALGETGIGREVMVVAPSRDLVGITNEIAAALRHSVTLLASPFSASTGASVAADSSTG